MLKLVGSELRDDLHHLSRSRCRTDVRWAAASTGHSMRVKLDSAADAFLAGSCSRLCFAGRWEITATCVFLGDCVYFAVNFCAYYVDASAPHIWSYKA